MFIFSQRKKKIITKIIKKKQIYQFKLLQFPYSSQRKVRLRLANSLQTMITEKHFSYKKKKPC